MAENQEEGGTCLTRLLSNSRAQTAGKPTTTGFGSTFVTTPTVPPRCRINTSNEFATQGILLFPSFLPSLSVDLAQTLF